MEIYTIGYTQKGASQFFTRLKDAGIKQLWDIRLNNTSQLAGFTKKEDLPFFLWEICHASYRHLPFLAPTQDILDDYKKKKASWAEYECRFRQLLAERRVVDLVQKEQLEQPTVLLCSEATAQHCHRRLVAEHLASIWGDLKVIHL